MSHSRRNKPGTAEEIARKIFITATEAQALFGITDDQFQMRVSRGVYPKPAHKKAMMSLWRTETLMKAEARRKKAKIKQFLKKDRRIRTHERDC
jgi:hypothetical protein